MVERMSIKAATNEDIANIEPNLWAGVGLGRVSVGSYTTDEISFNFQESIEARAVGKTNEASCHFTRGYLVGLVQQISDKGFKAVETACMSRGDEMCSIKLLPVFVVHLIMAELSVADSNAGPLMIRMRAAFIPTGRGWEAVWTEKIGMLTETAIANRSSLLMCCPHEYFTLLKNAPSSGRDLQVSCLLRLFPLACKVDEPEEKNSQQLRTTPCKRVGVRVGCGKAVGERLHEGDDLVFFRGRQTELTNRHVLGLWDLGCRPAVHLLFGSRGAVSGCHIERIYIPRVIEVDNLLQAL